MKCTFLWLIVGLAFELSLAMPQGEVPQQGQASPMWAESDTVVPEWTGANMEQGEFLEGDIVMPPNKNGVIDPAKRWPGAIIPYTVDDSYSIDQKKLIKESVSHYHRITCLRWVPRTNQRDYVYFKKENKGCWSYVGRIGGRQVINLQIPGCISRGTRVHEMMHAVGFWHEHSRPDRDRFINIITRNIDPEHIDNFQKQPASIADSQGVPYDFSSVMHYPSNAFNTNGRQTITAINGDGEKMGQRIGLAQSDYWKINRMYNCTSYPRGI